MFAPQSMSPNVVTSRHFLQRSKFLSEAQKTYKKWAQWSDLTVPPDPLENDTFWPLFVHFFFCAEGEMSLLTMFLSYFLHGRLTPWKSIFWHFWRKIVDCFWFWCDASAMLMLFLMFAWHTLWCFYESDKVQLIVLPDAFLMLVVFYGLRDTRRVRFYDSDKVQLNTLGWLFLVIR